MAAFVQCALIGKTSDKNSIYTVSYIPKKFAVVGNILKLKFDSVWSNGWKVYEIYPNSETDVVPNVKKMIKEHRKRTGDSFPKLEA